MNVLNLKISPGRKTQLGCQIAVGNVLSANGRFEIVIGLGAGFKF